MTARRDIKRRRVAGHVCGCRRAAVESPRRGASAPSFPATDVRAAARAGRSLGATSSRDEAAARSARPPKDTPARWGRITSAGSAKKIARDAEACLISSFCNRARSRTPSSRFCLTRSDGRLTGSGLRNRRSGRRNGGNVRGQPGGRDVTNPQGVKSSGISNSPLECRRC